MITTAFYIRRDTRPRVSVSAMLQKTWLHRRWRRPGDLWCRSFPTKALFAPAGKSEGDSVPPAQSIGGSAPAAIIRPRLLDLIFCSPPQKTNTLQRRRNIVAAAVLSHPGRAVGPYTIRAQRKKSLVVIDHYRPVTEQFPLKPGVGGFSDAAGCREQIGLPIHRHGAAGRQIDHRSVHQLLGLLIPLEGAAGLMEIEQPAIVAHRRLQRPHDILVCTGIAYIGVQFRKFHKATSSLFPYYNKLRPFSRCR